MTRFLAKVQKPHFWPLLAQNLAKKSFFRKSGLVTFLHLFFPNMMQKIRKNKPNGILDTRKYRIAKIAEIVEVADIAELWKLLEDIMKKKINRLKSFPIKIS